MPLGLLERAEPVGHLVDGLDGEVVGRIGRETADDHGLVGASDRGGRFAVTGVAVSQLPASMALVE